jgi:hypothetical protein
MGVYAVGARAARPGPGDLGRASRDFRERADRAVRDWQVQLLETVQTEGADKRATARVLAYGVNGLAVTLMIVAFAGTGGLVGAEVGIAGGSAVVGQKVLEAVFGDQAVRRLAAQARTDLVRRTADLLDGERARFLSVLEPLGAPPGAANGCARRPATSTTSGSRRILGDPADRRGPQAVRPRKRQSGGRAGDGPGGLPRRRTGGSTKPTWSLRASWPSGRRNGCG